MMEKSDFNFDIFLWSSQSSGLWAAISWRRHTLRKSSRSAPEEQKKEKPEAGRAETTTRYYFYKLHEVVQQEEKRLASPPVQKKCFWEVFLHFGFRVRCGRRSWWRSPKLRLAKMPFGKKKDGKWKFISTSRPPLPLNDMLVIATATFAGRKNRNFPLFARCLIYLKRI